MEDIGLNRYGYDLADEMFDVIGEDPNHEIPIPDLIRVLSFWGFNEEALKTEKIGFVCSCARDKLKKIFEKALVWDDYSLYDELISYIEIRKNAVLNKKELVELEDGQSFYCISPEDVETLPSVTPTAKIGHWVYKIYGGFHEEGNWHCSKCDYVFNGGYGHAKFCPECGCKMSEAPTEEVIGDRDYDWIIKR